MRPQSLLIVMLAITFGGIAAGGVMILSRREGSLATEQSTLVIASENVARGETLTASSVTAQVFPAGANLPGMITRVEDAVGRTTLIPLFKGEPLLNSKLAPLGAGRGLASLIKKGMRAISIPTPNVGAGVAGFIVPGSRVDIHWISNEPKSESSGSTGAEAPPLLENVEVLAVDDKLDIPAANRSEVSQMKSVTVQVSTEDAGKLTPALGKGLIHLSLRNPGDESRRPPARVVAPTVPVASKPVKIQEDPPRPRVMRILRGTSESTHRLDAGSDLSKIFDMKDNSKQTLNLTK